ncbi:MAG TPA: MSMEG_4193 family putative phosphomutase [Anaerolineales bacterium]|nr:MSMEG_4193 family putative phosphomutase [Anaerolineales bacterium]
MPAVLLVRHAENDYVRKGRLAGRLPGVHLNERGRVQAEKLAEVLKDVPVKAVYSSPLDRTLETAEPIAAAHGLAVIERPGLIELDFGDWEDKTLKALRRRKLWQTVQQRPSLMRFPDGETFAEAQLRVAAEIDTLHRLHKPKDLIVCVSHSDLIKLALAYFLGLPLDLFQRIMIAPASISTLLFGEGQVQVANMNQTARGKNNVSGSKT